MEPGQPVPFTVLSCSTAGVKIAEIRTASGPALHIGCQAGPFLVKPNLEEAAELTGLPATNPADWVAIARRILELGVSYVVISLGE